ncbi:site-specific integrase [Clostridium perfringens]|uniref:site-specific integrase n=1 Tax=Clostridium perfringens TaxID=1502 RepID=UPI0013E33CFC|nr:site-specific integrase [Clostridium perfringens]NGT78856.1 site-specific integrase [Clostridium perfringens]
MIVFKKIEGLDIIVKEEIEFSLSDKDKYIEEFEKLKEKRVVDENSEFEGESWVVTIAKVSIKLNFKINELFFKRITKGRNIGISFEEFNIAYRRYIAEMIYSDNSRGIIREFMSYTKYFLEKTSFLDVEKIEKVKLEETHAYNLILYERLLTVLEFVGYETPIEYIELYSETAVREYKSRKLPRFTSIFKFIDIMEKFKNNATEEELIRYYPVVLWHSISFIIPLRPSELLMTRFDCESKDDDKFFIKVRRSIKKGSPNKYRVESFDIENYYTEETVEINEKMYNEILIYKSFLAKHVPKGNKEFLFSADLYELGKRHNHKRGLNREVITIEVLKYLIDGFYVDIIQNKFGVDITERYSEESNELLVETLVPYDSRHLAIINLILMGNEHYTVMKLAGHNNISTTKGYYDHIEEYANAYSINYAKYLSGKKSNKLWELDELSISNKNNRSLSNWRSVTKEKRKLTKVDGGYCSYHLQDFSPCYEVNGNHNICNYFNANGIESVSEEIKKISQKIHSETKALKDLVDNAENIVRFSEKHSVLTQSIRYLMNKKALLAYKKEDFKEGDYNCDE